MLKWVLLIVGLVVLIAFVVAFIRFMLVSEKESKTTVEPKLQNEEYTPEGEPINIRSSSGGVPLTDMSIKDNANDISKEEQDFVNEIMADFDQPIGGGGFVDDIDDEFEDYSKFARQGRRRQPVDFDLEGEMADEYIPDAPDFSYLHHRRQPKQKSTLDKQLNELPTELKVLMLSDIFDRKFLD